MTDLYAVIGNPVAQTKSPRIHAEFARQLGQDLRYEAILAPRDGFAAAVAAKPQMFRNRGAERAAANDDEVERPQVAARWQALAFHVPCAGPIGRIGIGKRFVEGVADVAPQYIE